MADMETTPITMFYTDDHHRLDQFFSTYRQLKTTEPAKATEALRQFRAGLEQHMAWEESFLFSEFDARVQPPEESPTAELLADHAEILNLLDQIDEKQGQPSPGSDREEVRLIQALAAHNRNEETGLYRKLDEQLTAHERTELFARMKEASWDTGA